MKALSPANKTKQDTPLPGPTARVTIRDVARITGLSAGTVSAAINRRPSVKPATRKKVQEVVDALGYAPSPVGMVTNGKKSGMIGIAVPTTTFPLFTLLMQGLVDEAIANKTPTFVTYTNDEPDVELRMLRTMAQLNIDGLIIAPCPGDRHASFLQELHESGTPVVQVERRLKDVKTDSVVSDHGQAVYEQARRLMELHGRIAHVYGPLIVSSDRERIKAIRRAIRDCGGDPDAMPFIHVPKTGKNERDAYVRQLLDTHADVHGWLWSAEILQQSLVSEAPQRDHLEVVLFDGRIDPGNPAHPFTNVIQDSYRIGREAIGLLRNRIDAARAEEPQTGPKRRRVPCRVIEGYDIS